MLVVKQGIVENIKQVEHFYPGWTMRIYHDLQDGSKYKQNLTDIESKNGQILDLCYVGDLPVFGNMKSKLNCLEN
jgi:hypothetical protein